jgi:hypothetical protein
MNRSLLAIILSGLLLACGEEKKPDPPPPPNNGINAPTKISDGDRAIAIDPSATKIAYTSSATLSIRDIAMRATIDVGERIDLRYAPVFNDEWSRVAFVRAASGSNQLELAAFDLVTKAGRIDLSAEGRKAPELTEDGSTYVYLAQETGQFPSLFAWDLLTKTERMLAERATDFLLSSGSTVVYSSPNPEDELHVVDYLTGNDQTIAPVTQIAVVGATKKHLLFFSAASELRLLNMITGASTVLAMDATATGVNTAISADGSTVIFSREEATGRALYRTSTTNPNPERIFAYTEDARISADGSKVILWTYRGPANLFVWTKNEETLVHRTFWPGGGPHTDASMRLLVYSAGITADGADGELHIFDTEEKVDATMADPASPRHVYVANDGSRVAFLGGGNSSSATLRVWERATNQTIKVSDYVQRELVAAPDLSAIFFSTDSAKASISGWRKGMSAGSVLARSGGLRSVEFTPDGRRYVFLKGVDLYAGQSDAEAPAERIAQDVFGPTVLTETLVAYAVTRTSTAGGGVYIAPLP